MDHYDRLNYFFHNFNRTFIVLAATLYDKFILWGFSYF